MSNEEDDDQRQYRYVRKYYKMVKQFDEIIEIMDARTTQLKRRRVSSGLRNSKSTCAGGGGSNSTPLAGGSNNSRAATATTITAAATATATATARGRSNSKAAARNQLDDNNNVLVQTITRHLEDLKNDNPCPSDSTC